MTDGAKALTQSDVARRAGVNRATVSLALKNSPKLPKATRDRIQNIAREMGYVPDPMLSALAAYRSRKRPKPYQGTLAWLINSSEGFAWNTHRFIQQYHEGARRRATVHGYNLETFDYRNKGVTPARLAGIFRSRSIRGILLPPQPAPNTELDFPWESFSAVTFGYTLAKPMLHTVASTQFRAMVDTMRHIRELGYERIGLGFALDHDKRADHNYLAGFLVEQYLANPGDAIIPPFAEGDRPMKQFLAWFRKYRPEVLVTGNYRLLDLIEKEGLRIPGDLALACPVLPEAGGRLAGVAEDSITVGEASVDILVAMMQRGETGPPVKPQRVHVEGIWYPGETLPLREKRKSKA